MTGDWLPGSTPEAQGIPSGAIESFLDAAEERIDALHSVVLARHGHVVAQGWWEPYRRDLPHMLFSLSKSFTSTAVGLAVDEGRLSVDDPVLPFFPDAAPKVVGDHLAAMRVRHLLTMTTGHAADFTPHFAELVDADWAAAILEQPVEYAPGSRFVYDNSATYLLSAIVHRLTGRSVLEYLRPRLFEPLGIADAAWETCPRGVNTGAWGLNLRTPEVARFGQLYLDGGVWRGRRLVPADWVAAATARQVVNDGRDEPVDWEQGYGYQFWRCRHGAYRGDGAFGQFCLVLPEQDAVLVTTAGLADMQAVLDLAWRHLLPAMAGAPLPADTPAQRRLAARLSSLRLAPLASTAAPTRDVLGRRYATQSPEAAWASPPHLGGWPAPRACTVTAGAHGWSLTLAGESGDQVLPCGDGEWRTSEVPRHGAIPATPGTSGDCQPVAVSGGWLDPATFQARLCLPTTPFIRTLTCRYAGGDLTVTASDNVSFGPTEHPPLVAHATG